MTFGGGGGGGLVLGVPSFSSSPTTIMTGWSSRGCISCWVQRASVPRSWPVFVPSAPLHSQALCSSVRPGWVIKKARAQVVIIRGLSSKKAPTSKVMYAPSVPPPPARPGPLSLSQCCFEHCSTSTAASKCSVNISHKHLRTLPANINCTVNTRIHPIFFLPSMLLLTHILHLLLTPRTLYLVLFIS